MLKISNTKLAKPRKGRVGIGGNSRARLDGNEIDKSKMDNVKVDGSKVRDNKVGKKGRKTSKSKNLSKSKKTVESDFFTPGARLAFIKLRQAFVKAPIFHHFDSNCHIRVETNASGYDIGEVFN